MSSVEVFEKVIRAFHRRPDSSEALTLKQIASVALGSGNPKNASLVGRALYEFRVYLHPPSSKGYKWRVNWETVRRDHPNLLQPRALPSEPAKSSASPLAGMLQALEDEIHAVRQDLQQHPIVALGAEELGMASAGSFMYEAVIDLPSDAELPIPEGIGILLKWRGMVEPPFIEATLLNYDAVNARIIFEVERQLSTDHLRTDFVVVPRIEDLIKAIRNKLETLKSQPDAFVWRLFDPHLAPRILAWDGSLLTDGLDQSQLACLRACLTQDVTFMWGPPGTGKTHTLARIIARAALSGKRVLAAAIANVAVDQLAWQVVKALDVEGAAGKALLNDGRVIRFGHPRLPEVMGERRLFPFQEAIQKLRQDLHAALQQHRSIPTVDSMNRALLMKRIKDLRDELRTVMADYIGNARIVLTTVVQVCIEPAIAESSFDMAAVDEASMMPIPHLTCMGAMTRERFVVAGDFRQLGPIAVSRSRAALDWLHKDAYELVGIPQRLDHPVVSMLTLQRRMHRDICELINVPFYMGRLRTATSEERVRSRDLEPLPGKSVVLVSYTTEDGSKVEPTLGGSRANQGSAEVTVKVIGRCMKSDPVVRIGVITPYRAQVSLIKRLLSQEGLGKHFGSQVRVGTVHAFQGSEAEVIIWDMVETRHHPVGKLYRGSEGRRLVNVAISRAQGKLIVIGDRAALMEAPGADAVIGIGAILLTAFSEEMANILPAKKL